jgi:hypothetical protein
MGSEMPMPDLSHLTEEERETILMVMNRHKAEEKAEIQMYKSGNYFENICKIVCYPR